MPIDTVNGDSNLRNQVRARKGETLLGKAAQGDAANHPILRADLLSIQEAVELLCLELIGHGRRKPNPEALGPRALNTLPGTRPAASAAVAVVPLGSRAVQADLQSDAVTRQPAEAFEAPSGEQHGVGEHGRRRGDCAGREDLADVGKKKGLTASYEELPDTQLGRLSCDPSHAFQAQRASRRLRR